MVAGHVGVLARGGRVVPIAFRAGAAAPALTVRKLAPDKERSILVSDANAR